MGDSPEHRPKRQKRDSSYKSKAFEKFKQLKSGEKSKYEIEELENVYETVDEKEYTKRVLCRQDDDWIVDDDGSGYVEDGRDIFDDDLDSQSIAQATKGKGTKRKKKAVADNAGRGNLHQMISNIKPKKKEEVKIDDDAMLSELLGEIDETPSTSAGKSLKPKPISKNMSVFSQKKAANDYLKSFSSIKPKTISKTFTPNRNKVVLKEKQMNDTIEESVPTSYDDNDDDEEPSPLQDETTKIVEEVPKNQKSEEIFIEDFSQDDFDDDFDMSTIEEFESQPANDTNSLLEKTELEDLSTDWSSSGNDWTNTEQITNEKISSSDIPLVDVEDKKVFRFFWWDAFEDPNRQKGTVYLFGKTFCNKRKSFVSCCVAVRDIDRRLFILPRPYECDEQGKPTDKPVTYKELYYEFNEKVIKKLHITGFKSRYVQKKYAFNPEVPTESDYMEVRYPAKEADILFDKIKPTPRTFSRIFGLNSSFLEILLLDRKIKGPCWLDISNPVPVSNPVSWCQFEVNCTKATDIKIAQTEKPLPPPPLVVTAINMRCAVNPKTMVNEIVMLTCFSHSSYAVDKQAPNPPFQQHFCVFSCPNGQMLPLDIHNTLKSYTKTKVQKMNTEKALLNYFIMQMSRIDPDLIVGHDMQGYQINVFYDRLKALERVNSKLSKLSSTYLKSERMLFVGRLVCDLKISAKELIKSRSYELSDLCSAVLKTKENDRIELEPEDIPKMFQTSQDIIRLINCTMQDTLFIMRILFELNVIPLALQITNIAGNVMSRTLMGGRSERNEFLLLHAFCEKNYIVPDKEFKKKMGADKRSTAAKKKPSYSGGLVLDPKVGFYDKLILLMDFNSLYPSIIQEYNICFTTMPPSLDSEDLALPDRNLPPGILPTEIRKLVESRREVKKLMNNPDISKDLRMQYNIRQTALKLTANSMYGCLGFSNSRFYAKNLAALVTQKGREILVNTKDTVQKQNLEVVYGDTDSIMINTNILDYDQVMKAGFKIKQDINKLYKQVELDIDGVFKYLLLLKKKKYAAVKLSKNKDGKLAEEKEYKGLDIVRRDWSVLACEAGKFILEHILSDQSPDDRINNIHTYLAKVRDDLEQNRVPVPLLVITKQLTKDPKMYTEKNSLPHVQVALRYNQQSGGHLRAGDTVPYVICEDGSGKQATQRAYHVDELKNSQTLKIDIKYYLAQQIHPVVSRICEPIDGTDAFQIAECLGVDTTSFKKPTVKSDLTGVNITKPEVKFRNVDKFKFICLHCKEENVVDSAIIGHVPFLEKCQNVQCKIAPFQYLGYIQNQLSLTINAYIRKYYSNQLTCEDPACTNDTTRMPLKFAGKYPVCTLCQKGVMYRKYTENELYTQLNYFQYLFDISKLSKVPLMEQQVENGYHILRETVEKYLNHSGYSVVNLTEIFSNLFSKKKVAEGEDSTPNFVPEEDDDEDDI